MQKPGFCDSPLDASNGQLDLRLILVHILNNSANCCFRPLCDIQPPGKSATAKKKATRAGGLSCID